MAATNNPKRQMSPEQEAQMLLREEVVLRERSKGKSFYRIERDHPRDRAHVNLDGDPCKCRGLHNPDRIWRRAINRDQNAPWRRAEAIRLEEQRLDELQEGIWDKALAGDARAVEVALKVLERRARMNGLDFADYLSGKMVEVEQAPTTDPRRIVMAHIGPNGALITDETEIHTTAESEYQNGRLDAHLFPNYSRIEAERIEALDEPSFAERHWARGVASVLKDCVMCHQPQEGIEPYASQHADPTVPNSHEFKEN